MIIIRSSAEMARALASPLDADLKRLLALRRDQLLEYDDYDLGELATIVVAEPGDTIADLEAAAGVAFATNLVDGTRYGDPAFAACFEAVELHEDWIEAVLILSDDGFGVVLLVPIRPDTDPTLMALLRDHA